MPYLRPEERVGTVLAERYRLDRILGQGGMGVVFAGTHTWTHRPIAVKLLLPQYAEDAGLLQRFFLEARAATALAHPHVIDVLDMGEDDGEPFLVLEYLDGEPLSAILKREGRVEAGALIEMVLPVMDALARAHARGILHRDLKPDNLFLAKGLRGRRVPKLLDFGIAKLLESESTSTSTGSVVGTPYYMSPEQASGEKDLDGRADVWAMGVVCFEALSGRRPFTADTPAIVLARIVTQPAPTLLSVAPEVPAPIAAVVDRALRADKRARFDGMGEMITAFLDAAAEAGIEVDPALSVLRERDDGAATPLRAELAERPAPEPVEAPTKAPPRKTNSSDEASTAAPPMRTGPATPAPTQSLPAMAASAPAPAAAPARASRAPWVAVGAVLVLLGAGGVAWAVASGDETASVELSNESSVSVAEVYVRAQGSGELSWSDDLLAGSALPPGQTRTVAGVECGELDVYFVTEDGTECTLSDTLECGERGAWALSDDELEACADEEE